MFPINEKGLLDNRGTQYEFGNEALGILGMRRVDVDPEKSFRYKITDYKTGVRESRGLFVRQSLGGNIVKPADVVDAYINANRALYLVNRELYKDLDAAKVLGTTEDSLQKIMTDRGERRAFNALNEGIFRPLKISSDVANLFEEKAQQTNSSNAYSEAADVISRIQEVLSEVPLGADLFPDIENPFKAIVLPNLVDQVSETVTATTPVTATAGFGVGLQNTNIDPVSGLTASQEVLLDPLEQRYVKNKNRRTNTRLT